MSTVDSTVPHHGFHCEGDVCYRTADFLGFPGYRVGDDGSVWSRWKRGCKPVLTNQWRQLKLTAQADKHGALVVTLHNRQAKHMCILVHRLVLEAFVGPCPPGMECCHNPDRNPSNNHVENLRWDTRKSNVQDAIRHGTAYQLLPLPSRLSANRVRAIRTAYAAGGITFRALAALHGLSPTYTRGIVDRVYRKDVD